MISLTRFQRQVLSSMLISSAMAASCFAQQVPASSADSGRRAIISIDQTAINNKIYNAQWTANSANSYAEAAYYQADWATRAAIDAQNTATAALGRGGGFATNVFQTNYGGGLTSTVACIYGYNGPAAIDIIVAGSSQAYYCPAGSGIATFNTWVQGTESGGPGGGDGGGGGGG